MARVKPKAREDLMVIEMDGEAVVFDEETGELHHLNPAATIVFRLCDGVSTMFEMADDIAAVVGAPEPEVQQQVRAVVRGFRKKDLLEAAGDNPRPTGEAR